MMHFIKSMWKRFRSAVTGRFVSKEYADKHPNETIAETVKRP